MTQLHVLLRTCSRMEVDSYKTSVSSSSLRISTVQTCFSVSIRCLILTKPDSSKRCCLYPSRGSLMSSSFSFVLILWDWTPNMLYCCKQSADHARELPFRFDPLGDATASEFGRNASKSYKEEVIGSFFRVPNPHPNKAISSSPSI